MVALADTLAGMIQTPIVDETGGAVCLFQPVPAYADALTLSFQSPLNVNAGTNGAGLDVLLTDTAGSGVGIAGFTFEITTTSADIAFQDATTSTISDPYIFAGNSLFGPDIIVNNTGQDLSASDVFGGAGSVTLGAGQTLALRHILFNVSPSAPSETVNLAFTAYPATSLSDAAAQNIPIQTLPGGQVAITGSTGRITPVPEPSSLILLLSSAPIVWKARRRWVRVDQVGPRS
jgi:hypothetical protein